MDAKGQIPTRLGKPEIPMATQPASVAQSQPRVIRVFVSSTFRDMQAERDELAKRIFPQLRKLCENRGVIWGEVDLRWGVTDEQKAEGKVLPICLAEIHRCRPYFVGLLGERYGWVPDKIATPLLEREPWLDELRGRSVTELEILHGVLNNPQMAEHAFFYFRDPSYINSLSPEQQQLFREVPSPEDLQQIGADQAARRAEDRKRKLALLKKRIRESGFTVRQDYPDPRALGELVLEDLTKLINRLFPEGSAPDPLDREAAEHEAFARSRVGVYIGRQEYFDRLDAHARGDGPPLVVLGESGSGKSALLANWSIRYRAAHPEEMLLLHFIGATSASADWAAMLRRIMGEFKRRFGIEQEIPDKPDALRLAFANSLYMAAAKGRVVIVLDALNQLEDRDQAPDLVWLTPEVPANVRLVLSTLPGRPLDDLRKRGWPTLQIEPLNAEERKQVIVEYLAQSTHALSPARLDRVAGAQAAANPLYLRALLQELLLWGEHETLGQRIEHYLSAANVPDLYQKILERYEQDYERERPSLVRDAMSLLWAARRGLSEAELMDLLGSNGQPLPRAHWSPLYLAAEQSLVNRSGLIGFFHDYFRAAVRNNYLRNEQEQKQAHLRLADYFEPHEIGDRKLDELSWQLRQAEAWERLKTCLTDLEMFRRLTAKEKHYELTEHWVAIGNRCDMAEVYQESLREYEKSAPTEEDLADALSSIGLFFELTGKYERAELLLRRALVIIENKLGCKHVVTARSLTNLAVVLYRIGNYDEAEPLYRKAAAIEAKIFGPEDYSTAATLSNLAALLRDKGDYEAAEPLYRQALAIRQKTLGTEHRDTAQSLANLAGLLWNKGDYPQSESFFRQALAVSKRVLGQEHPDTAQILIDLANLLWSKSDYNGAEPLHRQVLAIRRMVLGPKHPFTATALNDLALVLTCKSDYAGAEPLYREALAINTEVLGPEHSATASILHNLGELFFYKGDYAEAERLFRQELAISERTLGAEHPEMASSLGDLAALLELKRDYDGAEPLFRRALALRRKLLGMEHPYTALSLRALAQLLWRKGNYEDAEPLYRQALELQERLLGGDNVETARTLNSLAVLLESKREYRAAEPLYRKALAIIQNALGQQHREFADTLKNLASVLNENGDYKTAEGFYRQALAIMEKALGPEHPGTAQCFNGLATALANQAVVLAQKMGKPRKALPLAEEAHRLAIEHGLTALAQQIKPILDSVRQRAH